jgi:hypothetical protein
MKPFICFTLGITLLVTAGYAARDVTCYEMIVPDTNTLYVEADAEIIPTLGIANLGDQAEPGSGMFPVKFFAIDTYGKINGVEGDTVFADTTLVDHIAQGDSMEVAITPWTPEGVCHETEPFVFYELIGLVRLGVGSTDTDDDPSNDTIKYNFTCLLSHDVGVVDLWWPEEPSAQPDCYRVGDTLTFHATVENFGFNKEYDIEIRMKVCDVDSNGVELWSNIQFIDSLDWRGNEEENPYTTEVVFPPYIVEVDCHHQSYGCRTELVGDLCPDNDDECVHTNDLNENRGQTSGFFMETTGESFGNTHQVRFSVPRASWVKLDVFDVDGRWVKSLTNDIYEPGSHAVVWDGRDNTGRKTSTGVYFVRIQADEFTDACKVVVIN